MMTSNALAGANQALKDVAQYRKTPKAICAIMSTVQEGRERMMRPNIRKKIIHMQLILSPSPIMKRRSKC